MSDKQSSAGRRRFLATAGLVLGTGTAGCSFQGGGIEINAGESGTDSPTDSPTDAPTPTETASPTGTESPTEAPTPTETESPTGTPTPTSSPTATATARSTLVGVEPVEPVIITATPTATPDRTRTYRLTDLELTAQAGDNDPGNDTMDVYGSIKANKFDPDGDYEQREIVNIAGDSWRQISNGNTVSVDIDESAATFEFNRGTMSWGEYAPEAGIAISVELYEFDGGSADEWGALVLWDWNLSEGAPDSRTHQYRECNAQCNTLQVSLDIERV